MNEGTVQIIAKTIQKEVSGSACVGICRLPSAFARLAGGQGGIIFTGKGTGRINAALRTGRAVAECDR
jgi:hypothetical protein